MRRTLTLIVLLAAVALADEKKPAVARANVKPVAAKPEAVVVDKKQTKEPVAEKRQDTYGSPYAPAQDTYGSPVAPAQDTYGSPTAPVQDQYGSPAAPVASYEAAPVQGEGTSQGYYYYYYPVANSYGGGSSSHGPAQSYNAPSKQGTAGGGGFLSGVGTGIIPVALIAAFLLAILVAIVVSFTGNASTTTGRSLLDSLYNLDVDDLAFRVYEAIELAKELY